MTGPDPMLTFTLLSLACRQAGLPDPGETDDTSRAQTFEVLLSAADDLQVHRLRFGKNYREEGLTKVWTWDVQDDFTHPHRPHGLSVSGDTVLVSLFDYEFDAFNLALDLETGTLLHTITTAEGSPWGGLPEREGERSTHNIIADPAGGYIISDTHNHRVSGLDENGILKWELSQSTIWEKGYVQTGFSNPNDVELFELNGEARLLVSCRGDVFNHVMWFKASTPLRPEDPPWELEGIFPETNNFSLIRQNHNPSILEDGTGFMVANSYYNRIEAFTWEGELIWQFPKADCQDSHSLDWPRGFDWTPNGTLLIADSSANRLLEVDPNQDCLDDAILWSLDDVHATYDVVVLP